jgi:cell wall assembly regulator SMI1
MLADWSRIVAWVEANAPELLDALEPPAERAELVAAEARLSMRLPTVLRAFYGLQNGTSAFGVFPALEPDQTPFGPLAIDEVELLEADAEDDAGEAEEDFEVDAGVRPEFWNPGWIPFATNDAGDYLLLDMSPARGGRVGQIIEWRHDTNERRIAAPSLEALLKQIADGLESGRYTYDGDRGVRHE